MGNVPTDRIIVTTNSPSPDPDLFDVGYYFSEASAPYPDGQVAMVELAKWVTTPHRFGKSGIGIRRINDGYYNVSQDYKHVREAINLMNPSPKN